MRLFSPCDASALVRFVLIFNDWYRVLTYFSSLNGLKQAVVLVVPGFTWFYWVLPGFTGFYQVLLGFTGFYWVFTEFYLVWVGSATGFVIV